MTASAFDKMQDKLSSPSLEWMIFIVLPEGSGTAHGMHCPEVHTTGPVKWYVESQNEHTASILKITMFLYGTSNITTCNSAQINEVHLKQCILTLIQINMNLTNLTATYIFCGINIWCKNQIQMNVES